MVDGVYLEEKGTFEGKCEVSVPLAKADRAGILEAVQMGCCFEPCFQIEVDSGRGKECFVRAQAHNQAVGRWDEALE